MTKVSSISSVVKRLKAAKIEYDYIAHSYNGKTIRFLTKGGKLVAIIKRKDDGVFPVKHDLRKYKVN